MIYLVVIILMFLSVIQYDLKKNHKKGILIYWFICVLLILITGFRNGLGGDTKNYMELWIEMPNLFKLNQDYLDSTRYQPGFIYFFSFIKTISSDYVFFQIIHGIIINVTLFWFFRKYSTAPFICILLFFILNYFEFNMEIVRESIAVCLGLLAYNFYTEHKWKVGLSLSVIAFLIHISAILLLLMPLCMKIRYTRKTIIFFLLTVMAVSIVFPLLPDLTTLIALVTSDSEHLMNRYDNREMNQTLTFYFFINHTLKCVVLPIFAMYMLKDRANNILGLAILYIVLFSMSTFSYGFYRFGNYVAPFYIIMLAMGFKEWILKFVKARLRPIYFSFFILLFLYMYQSYQLQVDANNGGRLYNRYIPYKSVIFNS